MESQYVPTLGRMLQLLDGLGFESRSAKPGVLLRVHPESGAEFLFRDRDPNTSARPTELVNLRVQLTARELLTEKELDDLLAAIAEPTTAPQ